MFSFHASQSPIKLLVLRRSFLKCTIIILHFVYQTNFCILQLFNVPVGLLNNRFVKWKHLQVFNREPHATVLDQVMDRPRKKNIPASASGQAEPQLRPLIQRKPKKPNPT
jgi:hypothetical protein